MMKTSYDLTRFEMQYPNFRYATAKELLNNVLLSEIHKRQRALSFSSKIINATRIEIKNIDQDGTLNFSVISDYVSESGFDVSKAREKGTKRHFIKPTKKLALSWLAGYIRFFSKGHWVSGIKRSNVIEKTVKSYTPKIQKMLDTATDNFYLKLVSSSSSSASGGK